MTFAEMIGDRISPLLLPTSSLIKRAFHMPTRKASAQSATRIAQVLLLLALPLAGCAKHSRIEQGTTPTAAKANIGCIQGGDETAINRALATPNSNAVLCQRAVFTISHQIVLSADGQQLYTDGSPPGDGRARIQVSDPGLSTAIFSHSSNISIHHVIVDGARNRFGRAPKGGALIEVGGDVAGISLHHIRAYDPRGWSVLHVFEGSGQCNAATISDNDLGPSGRPNGEWADGISFACRNGSIERNSVIDASDGAIVLFGAPGTLVASNMIVTRTNTLLGGINLVDHKPFDGDYTGVVVRDNKIEALGGYIKVGIAAGPSVWGDHTEWTNRGAVISNNTLRGNNFGYGIAVQGVEDFTITENRAEGQFGGEKGPRCHAQTEPIGGMFVRNFQMSSGTFQSDFAPGTLTYAICIQQQRAASK
jgi:hypothetical protein